VTGAEKERTMKGMIAVIALSVSVIGPSLAVADCAWVLWQRTVGGNGEIAWEPLSGGSESGCERTRDLYLAAERQVATMTQMGQDTTLWTTKKEDDPNTTVMAKMYKYRCLPDSVDPRGLKGK